MTNRSPSGAADTLNLELRESETRFRTLFDLVPVGVYTCDAAGVIQDFNRRAAELWGREPAFGDTDERFCGSYKLFRPDGSFMPHAQCPMAEVVSGNLPEVRDAEVLIERPDGSRITVIVNIRPQRNEHGVVTGAINCFYDVTKRKQADEAQARLAAVVDTSDDAIVSKDLNGIITSWNVGAERIFGYTAAEAIGQPIAMLIPADRSDEEPGILKRIRRGDRIEHYETVRRRKDGTLREISLAVSPVLDARGRIVGASKIARDITSQKRVTEAMRQSEERVRLLAQMTTALENERRRIARDLHDQLGQQLTALRVSLSVCKEHALEDDRLRQRLVQAESVASQLDAEIDFLTWQLRSAPLDVGVVAAIETHASEWSQHFGVAIDVHTSGFGSGRLLPQVEASLYRIAQEALNNVAKHAGASRVALILERRDDSAVLVIEDNGRGFDVRQSVSDAKNQRFGVIGMRERAAEAGGRLDVESEPGSGTTVIARIPLRQHES